MIKLAAFFYVLKQAIGWIILLGVFLFVAVIKFLNWRDDNANA